MLSFQIQAVWECLLLANPTLFVPRSDSIIMVWPSLAQLVMVVQYFTGMSDRLL